MGGPLSLRVSRDVYGSGMTTVWLSPAGTTTGVEALSKTTVEEAGAATTGAMTGMASAGTGRVVCTV